MTNLLNSGVAWLVERLRQHASQAVTYVRGSEQVSLDVTVLSIAREAIDPISGAITIVTGRDYLFPAASLILGGSLTRPQPGDRIYEADGATIATHEVAMLPGEDCWKWNDPYRVTMRVHANLIAETPVS